jgi:formate/nitrite transporter FocA (FNT family)
MFRAGVALMPDAGTAPSNAGGEDSMRVNAGRAMLGGVVGTAMMTAMMYFVAPMMTGMPMDIAAMLGSMLGGSWTAGMAMHVMLGTVVFPLAYAFGVVGWLQGPPIARGLAWGGLLWLLAQVVVMPMMGAGVFSSQMGGLMTAAGSLMGHLVYGGLLGGIAGAEG